MTGQLTGLESGGVTTQYSVMNVNIILDSLSTQPSGSAVAFSFAFPSNI